MRKTSFLLAAVAIAAAVPAVAQDVRTVEVRYGDLNMSEPAAVAELHARVRSAVDAVCGSPDAHDLSANITVTQCRTDAMNAARQQFAANRARAHTMVASR